MKCLAVDTAQRTLILRTIMNTFRVEAINIDFKDDDFEASPQMQQDIIDEVLCTVWEAADSEDLVEEITTAIGFPVLDIDYHYMLKSYN